MTKIFVGGGKERGSRREEGIFSEKERGRKSGKADALSCFEKVRGGLFGCFSGEEGE